MRGEILKSATESHDIQQVLENENLVRKQVSEGEDSLFRAFSEGLYFTPNYFHQIKDLLIRNLSNLITTNTLPTKLEIFRGNSVLWSDYSKNPSSSDFFRINLELFSLAFKIRVAVYTVTTDGILNAKIFNNKFDKSVQFINPNGVHLDALYNKDTIQNIESSHDPALKAQAAEWKETCAKDSKESKLEEKTKGSFDEDSKVKKLKKTKSDSDLSCAKDHLDLYNMFVDLKPSNEFSTLIEKDISKLGQTADINLIPEPRLSFDKKSATSDEQPHHEKLHLNLGLSAVRSFPNDRRVILEEEDEDLPSGDAIKLEKSKSYMDPKRDPMHFGNQIPPGLTPNRYSTKTYGTEVTEEVKPRHRFSESHAHPVDLVQQPNSSHLTPNSKNGGRSLNLNAHSEEFNKGNANVGESSSHDVPVNPPLIRAQSQRVTGSEKKKPVILDESQHRYTGRLKFFDEGKSYGFIVMDDDGSDIFVHYDDLHKANMNKEFLRNSKFGNSVRLSFSCMEYIGKYNRSRKATDIQFLT